MRRVIVAVILTAFACGGDDAPASRDGIDYPQPNTARASEVERQLPTTPPTGVVHEVRMLRTPDGRYTFEPAERAIRDGDLVRWTVVDGVPHNVAFYPESIPAGAASFLVSAIPSEGKISPLGGRVLVEPGETFEILFVGAPAGRYRYFCVPHEVAGMKGTLVVRPR